MNWFFCYWVVWVPYIFLLLSCVSSLSDIWFAIIFSHLFSYFLSFESSLCILDNSPVSDMSFANIFSQSVACVLILLRVSFTELKFLILMKSSLSVISFMGHGFGVVPKKLLPNSRSSKCSPRLSYSFTVWCFMVYIHDVILFVHKKEGNPAICDMDGIWGHYATWNKSVRGRPILYDLNYMWNLKKPNSESRVVVARERDQNSEA